MTRYYPKLMDLKYKDKWLNISIPIRIKILKVKDYVCEKCHYNTNKKNMINYCIERKIMFDENYCPMCNNPIISQERKLYKLYTDIRKPLINVSNILNYYTPFAFREIVNKYTDLYAIERKELAIIYQYLKDFKGIKNHKRIKELDKVVKFKIYELTEEQLEDDYDKYQMRRVAKAI